MNVEPAPLRVPSPLVQRYEPAVALPGADEPGADDAPGVAVAPGLEQAASAIEAATASAPKRRIPMVNVDPP